MLVALSLRCSYRSDNYVVLRDFHLAYLSETMSHNRDVGYFTSASLDMAARGLNHLIQKGGTVRLVASTVLNPECVKALASRYEQREAVERIFVRELNRSDNPNPKR